MALIAAPLWEAAVAVLAEPVYATVLAIAVAGLFYLRLGGAPPALPGKLQPSGVEKLTSPAQIATIIPTPTVKRGDDKVIYMTGSPRLLIDGTGFRAKSMTLVFDPPIQSGVDYIMQPRSEGAVQLTLKSAQAYSKGAGDHAIYSLVRAELNFDEMKEAVDRAAHEYELERLAADCIHGESTCC